MGFLLHHLLGNETPGSENVAVVDGERQFTYGEFARAVNACASRLGEAGLERGERVAIYLPKSFEECWSIFGTARADGVFVPVNAQLKAPQVKHIVEDCEARVLITCRSFWERVGPELGACECLGSVLLIDAAPEAEGECVFADAFANVSGEVPEVLSIGEDLAAILYTSGSTGLPKGVMLSHANLLAGTRIVRTYLGITQADRILSVLPFSFDYGLNQLLTAVEQRAKTVLLNFRFGDEVARALETHQITGLAGVPSLWAILTRAAPYLQQADLSHLRYITNSGGAVPTDTVAKLRALMPDTSIFLMYGLTEAFRSTYLPPDEIDRRPGSMGKAIPECEVFAVNANGERCGPGETGVLVHRGPTVSLGYWNNPQATAKVIRPNPLRPAERGGEPVCYSGDLVRQDEEGFFYFVGRDDAMIKSSGYRISPTEVEEALMVSGCFAQVAAIGLPDPVAGQRVHAVAVAAQPGVDVSAALAACAKILPSHTMPRDIEIVDRLPVSPNGKVDYKQLVNERLREAAE